MSSEALGKRAAWWSEPKRADPSGERAKLLAALLAEVAKLERAAEHAEEQRATYAKAWVDQQYRLQAAEAALAVAREREQRAVEVLRELADAVQANEQLRTRTTAELREAFGDDWAVRLGEASGRVNEAERIARAALVDKDEVPLR